MTKPSNTLRTLRPSPLRLRYSHPINGSSHGLRARRRLIGASSSSPISQWLNQQSQAAQAQYGPTRGSRGKRWRRQNKRART